MLSDAESCSLSGWQCALQLWLWTFPVHVALAAQQLGACSLYTCLCACLLASLLAERLCLIADARQLQWMPNVLGSACAQFVVVCTHAHRATLCAYAVRLKLSALLPGCRPAGVVRPAPVLTRACSSSPTTPTHCGTQPATHHT
jgi:hypothetical protein